MVAAPGISASPSEENMRYFNVMILGPTQSPYEGNFSWHCLFLVRIIFLCLCCSMSVPGDVCVLIFSYLFINCYVGLNFLKYLSFLDKHMDSCFLPDTDLYILKYLSFLTTFAEIFPLFYSSRLAFYHAFSRLKWTLLGIKKFVLKHFLESRSIYKRTDGNWIHGELIENCEFRRLIKSSVNSWLRNLRWESKKYRRQQPLQVEPFVIYNDTYIWTDCQKNCICPQWFAGVCL